VSTSATEGGTGAQTDGAGGAGTGAQTATGTDGTGAQGTQTDQNGNTGNGGDGSGDQIDLSTITDPAVRTFVEKQQKAAKEAREDAARRRQENQTLKDQVDQFQRQNETDAERQSREAAEREAAQATERQRLEALEAENRDLKVGGVILSAATEAKAHNPALVVEMLKAKATLDESGKVTNLPTLLTDLKKSDPYLFKRAATDAGRGNGSGEGSAATTSVNDMIRQAAGRTRIGGGD
jgi:hypothetical protein